MKLKKVEIVGFKSFADRAVIHVDDHVTGIIGPNGCGKSNIVDAIRWCMGEQSAKHLRGSGMADVIFAGSASRGPGAMAEVTLVLENQGDAPPDYATYAEIAITRRLYADGTSEYLVNRIPARLRDITELLLGTGTGTKGYSIIEQGQVGRIVSSKPENRRQILDEAAGITKFKAQKVDAERKMQACRQNLLRVRDVIGELESRLSNLRRQAQKAERYKRYRDELRDLELWVASHRWLELSGIGAVLAARHAELAARVESLRTEVTAGEGRLAACRLDLSEVERELSERQQALFDLDNRIQLVEAENQYRERERGALRATVRQAGAELEVSSRTVGGLEGELAQVAAERSALTEGGGGAGPLVERLQAEHEAGLLRLRADSAEVRDLRAQVADTQAKRAVAIAQIESRREALVDLERRARSAGEAAARCSGRIDAVAAELATEGAAAEGAAAELARLREARARIDHARAGLRRDLAAAEVELDTTRAELHRARSRLQSLQEIQSRYRSCSSGVQALMAHRERLEERPAELEAGAGAAAPARRVLGIMADYLHAPAHLEHAVAAVLGDRLQGVVVDATGSAVRGVELLKELQEGRTAFLPRDVRSDRSQASGAVARKIAWRDPAVPDAGARIEVVDLSATEASSAPAERSAPSAGVLGRLADLIEVGDEVGALGRDLIGSTVVVDSLPRALELWQRGEYAAETLVTLDGDRLEPSGVVVGGSPTSLDSALLQQKREIDELGRVQVELEGVFEAARARLLGLGERQAELELEREQNDRDVVETEQLRAVHGERLAQRALERDRLQGEAGQVAAERAEFAAQIEVRARELDGLAALAESLAAGGPERLARIEALEVAIVGHEQGLESLGAELTAAKIELARFEQQCAAFDGASARLGRQIASETDRADRLRQQLVEAEGRITALGDELVAARAEHEQLVGRSREATDRVHDSRERFEALRRAAEDLELVLREFRNGLDAERDRLKDVELGVQENDLERSHLEQDVLARMDVALIEVLCDHHARPPTTAVEHERQAELRRILARMGEVNLTAIAECEEVSARYDKLVAQRDDLDAALLSLQEAIDRINVTTRQRFQDTFDAVNHRFQAVFPRLFNGGRAELVMTDPSNLLETGIEIVAQPPGKQLRSLELLSGGEKALTAVSLVFAIFLVKPSPFCILDEVDAPLDDANVGRFSNLVSELARGTQFLIITHNKLTMESADRLYGVTMEQRGVSKLVSVNMRRTVDLAQA